jgi:hypothetical protein
VSVGGEAAAAGVAAGAVAITALSKAAQNSEDRVLGSTRFAEGLKVKPTQLL